MNSNYYKKRPNVVLLRMNNVYEIVVEIEKKVSTSIENYNFKNEEYIFKLNSLFLIKDQKLKIPSLKLSKYLSINSVIFFFSLYLYISTFVIIKSIITSL